MDEFEISDWVTFRHQAVQRYGYILKIDPRRSVKGHAPGAAFVRVTNTRGGQTSIWLPLEILTKSHRSKAK